MKHFTHTLTKSKHLSLNNNIKYINNYEIDEIERKILLMKTMKDFNECVDNHNLSPDEKERELLRKVFEFSNIKYKN